MSPFDLEKLHQAQAAEVQEQTRHERRRRFFAWWARVRFSIKRTAKLVKTIAEIVGGIAAVLGFGYKAVRLIKARNVAPAELPATGVASTAPDFVEKPKPKQQ